MLSDLYVSPRLGALRNTGHWVRQPRGDECSGVPRGGRCSLPGARAEVLESFTETRVEPGEGVGGDLEEEGHPGPGKMHEPKFRGTKGRPGPGMVPV